MTAPRCCLTALAILALAALAERSADTDSPADALALDAPEPEEEEESEARGVPPIAGREELEAPGAEQREALAQQHAAGGGAEEGRARAEGTRAPDDDEQAAEETPEEGQEVEEERRFAEATQSGSAAAAPGGGFDFLHAFASLMSACAAGPGEWKCTDETSKVAGGAFAAMLPTDREQFTPDEADRFQKRFARWVNIVTTKVVREGATPVQYPEWAMLIYRGFKNQRPAVTEQLVHEINRASPGWTARYDAAMAAESWNTVAHRAGLDLSDAPAGSLLEGESARAIPPPERFDARERWPHCRGVLSHVREQDCHNSWSHAQALVTEGRLCVATGGRLNGTGAWLSQSWIATCRADGKGHCRGGGVTLGDETVRRRGVPTGGPGRKGNAPPGISTCLPQVDGKQARVTCPTACAHEGYRRELADDLFKVQYRGSVRVYRYEQSAQQWFVDGVRRGLLEQGPIVVGLMLYRDFRSYKSGIYSPSRVKENNKLGGHAVTGMGFGPGYVLCVNSWGTRFGMGGSFRVAIDALLVAAVPAAIRDTSSYPLPLP